MLQKRKEEQAGQETTNLDKLKERFAQEKEQVIEAHPEERQVELIVHMDQFCGCGGKDDVKVTRTVPWDSPLQDGDAVDGLDDSDEVIGYV